MPGAGRSIGRSADSWSQRRLSGALKAAARPLPAIRDSGGGLEGHGPHPRCHRLGQQLRECQHWQLPGLLLQDVLQLRFPHKKWGSMAMFSFYSYMILYIIYLYINTSLYVWKSNILFLAVRGCESHPSPKDMLLNWGHHPILFVGGL